MSSNYKTYYRLDQFVLVQARHTHHKIGRPFRLGREIYYCWLSIRGLTLGRYFMTNAANKGN